MRYCSTDNSREKIPPKVTSLTCLRRILYCTTVRCVCLVWSEGEGGGRGLKLTAECLFDNKRAGQLTQDVGQHISCHYRIRVLKNVTGQVDVLTEIVKIVLWKKHLVNIR